MLYLPLILQYKSPLTRRAVHVVKLTKANWLVATMHVASNRTPKTGQ